MPNAREGRCWPKLSTRFSSHVTVRNCSVHDNGHWNVLVTKSAQFSGGILEGGFHLIEDNEVFDGDAATCGGASNSACPGQTYYGIHLDNNPGAGTVIRNNVVHGNVDNLVVCGDESAGRDLAEATSHVLELTGNGEGWTNHDTVVSGNHAYDAKDDDIELDGICVNARIFDNRFGNAENPISMAPGLPGPYFVLRNVISGDIQQAAIKMNTAGTPNSLIRNFYFYHNTIARSTQGTLLNLWYAVPGDHDVPIKNVVFRNNVFWAMAGGRATDVNNQGSEHPSFDYDLWYTSDTQNVFQWWNGSSTDKYDTFSEWQAGTGQETHGLFAEPGLDSDFVPTSSSPVVDAALVIDGVNDGFAGAAPDIGAYEVGDTPAGGTGGGSGGAAGAGAASSGGSGGAGAVAGSSAATSSGSDDGGCGCRSTPRGSTGLFSALLLVGLGLLRRFNGARS